MDVQTLRSNSLSESSPAYFPRHPRQLNGCADEDPDLEVSFQPPGLGALLGGIGGEWSSGFEALGQKFNGRWSGTGWSKALDLRGTALSLPRKPSSRRGLAELGASAKNSVLKMPELAPPRQPLDAWLGRALLLGSCFAHSIVQYPEPAGTGGHRSLINAAGGRKEPTPRRMRSPGSPLRTGVSSSKRVGLVPVLGARQCVCQLQHFTLTITSPVSAGARADFEWIPGPCRGVEFTAVAKLR